MLYLFISFLSLGVSKQVAIWPFRRGTICMSSPLPFVGFSGRKSRGCLCSSYCLQRSKLTHQKHAKSVNSHCNNNFHKLKWPTKNKLSQAFHQTVWMHSQNMKFLNQFVHREPTLLCSNINSYQNSQCTYKTHQIEHAHYPRVWSVQNSIVLGENEEKRSRTYLWREISKGRKRFVS